MTCSRAHRNEFLFEDVFRLFLLHLYSRLFDRWAGVFGFCTSGFQDAFRGTSEMIADRRTPVDCVLDRYPPTCCLCLPVFSLARLLVCLFARLLVCLFTRQSLCLFLLCSLVRRIVYRTLRAPRLRTARNNLFLKIKTQFVNPVPVPVPFVISIGFPSRP